MSVSVEAYFGGATEQSISSNLTLIYNYRVWKISATTTSLLVTLPNVDTPFLGRPGGPHFIIWNSGSNSFTVRNSTGTITAVLAANRVCVVSSIEFNSVRSWIIDQIWQGL